MYPSGAPPGPIPGGLGVTCRPHATTVTAVSSTSTKPSLRIMRSSWLRDAGVAACAALALAAAFPKFGAAWLVPFGTAALFWTWQGASWKRAGASAGSQESFSSPSAIRGSAIRSAALSACSAGLALVAAHASKRRFSHSPAHSPRSRTSRCDQTLRRLAPRPRLRSRMVALDRRARGAVRSAGIYASEFTAAAQSRPMPARTGSRSFSARSARTWPTGCTGARGARSHLQSSPSRCSASRRGPPGRHGVFRHPRFRLRRSKATSRNRLNGIGEVSILPCAGIRR